MPDPSPSNADNLSPTSYSSEGVVAGHSGQFTPPVTCQLWIHTTLAGIEIRTHTFRLLVRPAVSSATNSPGYIHSLSLHALVKTGQNSCAEMCD